MTSGERRLAGQRLHSFSDVGADVGRNGFAVNAASGHGFSL
jgi:hypothetical protein